MIMFSLKNVNCLHCKFKMSLHEELQDKKKGRKNNLFLIPALIQALATENVYFIC